MARGWVRVMVRGSCYNVNHILFSCTFSRSHPHLQVADVFEDKGIVDVDGLADLVIHGINVGLVNGHALPCQRRSVVYGNVMELWMVLPVLI